MKVFIVSYFDLNGEPKKLNMLGRSVEHVRSWALTNPRVQTIISVKERVV